MADFKHLNGPLDQDLAEVEAMSNIRLQGARQVEEKWCGSF